MSTPAWTSGTILLSLSLLIACGSDDDGSADVGDLHAGGSTGSDEGAGDTGGADPKSDPNSGDPNSGDPNSGDPSGGDNSHDGAGDSPGSNAEPSDDTSQGSGGELDTVRKNFPCAGCQTYAPAAAAEGAVPMLVALHGDEGNPEAIASVWKPVAKERKMLLLAPKCPADEGCAHGSWWRWSGDPSWLDAQVNKVMSAYDVDLRRVYLTGWSGGATYGTLVAAFRGARYAAIELLSGGFSPRSAWPDIPCLKCAPPMSWLVGQKDPLLPGAKAAHGFFSDCGFDTELTVLKGKGHDLGSTLRGGGADDIAGWMLEHSNECAPWPR